MRILSNAGLTALRGSPVPLAVLVEMDLASGALYLNSTGSTLNLSGTTYLGAFPVGKIDTIGDTPGEMKALQFELSGVPASQIALALTEPVQGRAVRIKLAIFDPATLKVLDTDLRWAGRLDTLNIGDGQPTASLQASAEHSGIDLLRPLNSLYSDAEQQRLNPGDLGLQFMADQVDMRVVWPTAEFFRK